MRIGERTFLAEGSQGQRYASGWGMTNVDRNPMRSFPRYMGAGQARTL